MTEAHSFGTLVRRQRKALDLTQAALARRVGCAESLIRKIEAEERRPSRQVAERLAEALQLAPAERELFVQIARGERPVAELPLDQRRANAEAAMRHLGRAGVRVSILRVPGIYAPDREGGTPEARLRRATPVLAAPDDVYTNHIHADDLARACLAALWRGRPQRTYNVADDSQLKMGDYFDLAADLYGLPRPPRVPRSLAQEQLPLSLLSFMGESRRLVTTRMTRELRLCLRYPTVREGLASQPIIQRG